MIISPSLGSIGSLAKILPNGVRLSLASSAFISTNIKQFNYVYLFIKKTYDLSENVNHYQNNEDG